MTVRVTFLEARDSANELTTLNGSFELVRFSVGSSCLRAGGKTVHVDTDALLDAVNATPVTIKQSPQAWAAEALARVAAPVPL